MQPVVADAWTWVLHSSLLIVAIFGRFTKVWSVRNLDLFLLIGLTPALYWSESPWVLYAVTGLIALRLLFDCRFTRRPRIDPNLNAYGLAFLCAAAFIVLTVRAFVTDPPSVSIAEEATNVLNRQVTAQGDPDPTTTLVATPAVAISQNIVRTEQAGKAQSGLESTPQVSAARARKTEQLTNKLAMRILAVVAHAAIVIGFLVLGTKHFGSFTLGLAMSSLYLVLPCTAYFVHNVTHALPAAFLLWAFVMYRRPIVAGSMLAFATGALFSTVFLIPLWAAFYGRRRILRFGVGIVATGLLLTTPFLLTSGPLTAVTKLSASINSSVFNILSRSEYQSVEGLQHLLRLPLMILFGCVFVSVTLWPRYKQLSHLVAHSTVLVVLSQLWYPEAMGVYVLWYLPVLLLVVFRPRLRHLEEEEREARADAAQLARAEKAVGGRSPVATSPLMRR